MDQLEIKFVLFSPTVNWYAVDVYVDGKRFHTGRAHVHEQGAISEALAWMELENVRWQNCLRVPEIAPYGCPRP
jgi:hypothetical protein